MHFVASFPFSICPIPKLSLFKPFIMAFPFSTFFYFSFHFPFPLSFLFLSSLVSMVFSLFMSFSFQTCHNNFIFFLFYCFGLLDQHFIFPLFLIFPYWDPFFFSFSLAAVVVFPIFASFETRTPLLNLFHL